MLIYLISLGVLAALTFLIQAQLYSHSYDKTSETDCLDEMGPLGNLDSDAGIA